MADLVWDERLITRAEAYELAADWPVRPGIREGLAFLDCGRCGLAAVTLGAAANPFVVTVDFVVAAVLRHMVSGHGQILNRRNRGDGAGDGAGLRGAAGGGGAGPPAGRAGGGGRGDRPDPAAGRPPAEEAGGDGEPGAAGGGAG